jgi:hypothetical protein
MVDISTELESTHLIRRTAMENMLRIGQLEDAINRCRNTEPYSNGVLPPDMRALATLYGLMIFNHLETISLNAQPATLQQLIAKWGQDHRLERT